METTSWSEAATLWTEEAQAGALKGRIWKEEITSSEGDCLGTECYLRIVDGIGNHCTFAGQEEVQSLLTMLSKLFDSSSKRLAGELLGVLTRMEASLKRSFKKSAFRQ